MFNTIKITDHAKTAQLEIADHLEMLGYSITLEYPIKYNSRDVRIDIVANGEKHLAIEVDRSTPRKKSFEKLLKYQSMHSDAELIILLRGERKPYIENGVAVIGVKKC